MLNTVYYGIRYLMAFPYALFFYLGVVFLYSINGYFKNELNGLFDALVISILFSIPIFLVLGCVNKYKSNTYRERQAYYQTVFSEMKLISTNGLYPIFFHEEENEFLKILYFKSFIPLDVWNNKKSLLETFLNERINKIENEENNKNVVLVYIYKKDLPQLIEWDDQYFLADKDTLLLGFDDKDCIVMDLNKNPHTFVAGETGSGKTNLLKCLIYQCLVKNHAVILIDFKRGVSFSVFRDFVKIYSDYEKIQVVLQDLVQETNNRLDLFVKHEVEDINEYNRLPNASMRRIIVFIDELAELMRTSDKDAQKAITNALETLTRLSRAVGINLIMGLQRPDSTIINGQIKNNVSLRICGRFVDPEPSRIMLNSDIATTLPSVKGRFIYKDTKTLEFQSLLVTSENMAYMKYYREKFLPRTIALKEDSLCIEVDDTKIISEKAIIPIETEEKKGFVFNFDDIL